MKKLTTFILLIILLLTVTVTFVGCGDKDFSDFEKRIGELENNYNGLNNNYNDLNNNYKDLNNKYNDLDVRVKKLEATISLLDTVGESEQFTELKNKVIALQKDLVDNTANDTQIKTQVTQMQLALDKIAGGGNVDDTVLLEIQNKINTLYGEVNRVLPFENGKEYEVKLNGVVYYTVTVLIEYHNGVVQSNNDIKECDSDSGFWQEHFCGSVLINNKRERTITLSHIKTSMIYNFDNSYYYQPSISDKKGTMTYEVVDAIEPGQEARWYFYINNSSNHMPKKSFNLTFRLPELNAMTLLTLDNVWGDENGLKPPIVGTK